MFVIKCFILHSRSSTYSRLNTCTIKFVPKCNCLVDFDQRYSAYPTPTYPSDSVSLAKNSEDVTGKTKSARNFIYTLIR